MDGSVIYGLKQQDSGACKERERNQEHVHAYAVIEGLSWTSYAAGDFLKSHNFSDLLALSEENI